MTNEDKNLQVIEDLENFIFKIDALVKGFKFCQWIIFFTSFPYILWAAIGTGGISPVPLIALISLPLMIYIINSLLAEHVHLFFLKPGDLYNEEDDSASDSK